MCKKIKQPHLNTERLILRPLTLSDGPRIQELAGDWAVAKTTLSIPHPYEDGMAETWISSLAGAWEDKNGLVYAVLLKENHDIIGVVSLVSINGTKAELGYWIGKQYWGNGYCTESAKVLMKFTSQQLPINKFLAEHLTENPASGKVMLKLGMNHRKTVERIDRYGKLARVEIYESNIRE